MNLLRAQIGKKVELELINSINEKIGQSYFVQLSDFMEDSIKITSPANEVRLMLVNPGIKVRIVFASDEFSLYSFHGIIIGKSMENNKLSLQISISSKLERIQRREHFRLDYCMDIQYRLYHPENEVEKNTGKPKTFGYMDALTKNLSGSGACIVSDKYLPKGTLIELVLMLDDDKAPIKIVCKIARNTEIMTRKGISFELGLHYCNITPKDQDSIIKFIFSRQRSLLKNGVYE